MIDKRAMRLGSRSRVVIDRLRLQFPTIRRYLQFYIGAIQNTNSANAIQLDLSVVQRNGDLLLAIERNFKDEVEHCSKLKGYVNEYFTSTFFLDI